MKKITICFLAVLLILSVALAALAEPMEATATADLIDLTGLINAVIALLGALISFQLIPWLKARTTQSQQEGLSALAKTLVYAAEQLYRTGTITDRLHYVEEKLRAAGYTADRSAIEAAVTQLRIDNCAYMKDFAIPVIEEATDYEEQMRVHPSETENPPPIQAQHAQACAGSGAVFANPRESETAHYPEADRQGGEESKEEPR